MRECSAGDDVTGVALTKIDGGAWLGHRPPGLQYLGACDSKNLLRTVFNRFLYYYKESLL